MGSKKEKQWSYFKIEDGDEGVAKYCLIHQGKHTENILSFGEKRVHLNELSFSKESDFVGLRQMLNELMEREKIDIIQTNNLTIAKRLWGAGLVTDGALTLGLPDDAPLSRYYRQVVRMAIAKRKRLSSGAQSALQKIEEQCVKAVVSDSFIQDRNVRDVFHEAIERLEVAFPGMHLTSAAERLEASSEYASIKAMIADFKKEILPAVSSGLDISLTVDLPWPLLFELSKEVDVPHNHGGEIISVDRPLSFKKGKN